VRQDDRSHADDEVPGHHGPHRRRQQVHALWRTELVDGQPGDEAQTDRPDDPGPAPEPEREPGRRGRVAWQQSRQARDGTGPEEALWRGLLADGRHRLHRGPLAIVAAPGRAGHAGGCGTVMRQQQHGLAGFGFRHPVAL